MKIAHAELVQRLWYCEETGRFYCRKTGRLCGTIHKSRVGLYRRTSIDGYKYMDHVLAWFYMKGVWPDHQIDHRDRQSLNNRWDNLRETTQSVNQFNKAVYKNNRLGVRGVTKTKRNAYVAKIYKDGKAFHLGSFSTLKAAIAARRKAELEHYGGYADDNYPCGSGGGQCEQGKRQDNNAGTSLPARDSFRADDTPSLQPQCLVVASDSAQTYDRGS